MTRMVRFGRAPGSEVRRALGTIGFSDIADAMSALADIHVIVLREHANVGFEISGAYGSTQTRRSRFFKAARRSGSDFPLLGAATQAFVVAGRHPTPVLRDRLLVLLGRL
ncbi:hypothetical protein [Niveibacterium sp.]|uniref:hypothetical protein n=1 Tax=Niveibacterium sp. TaxID=2017444 RepID=UPI0035B3BB18